MFDQISEPLVAQAYRIAKGNKDHAQDILAMAYCNHQSASSRGKELSPGELVVFMKHRCGELRQGARLPFGNKSGRSTGEVYRTSNYLNGDVELLSLDFVKDDGDDVEGDGHGFYTSMTATKDVSDSVLFEIGFCDFLKGLDKRTRKALLMRVAGYSYGDIARRFRRSSSVIREQVKQAGRKFIEYFELPQDYLVRFGLA
jgi:hypothetical protein